MLLIKRIYTGASVSFTFGVGSRKKRERTSVEKEEAQGPSAAARHGQILRPQFLSPPIQFILPPGAAKPPWWTAVKTVRDEAKTEMK
ncbi:unnamed protein product [Caenorhabditis auriculariae]|uniref:Uncharacterized protein n=1 Tax=Caenorhabditis auriculariae TaxID=2777116 RepID=A0A8S1HJ33_9PELO|nr:unnamed protein product [Caenorhabditis auriculariae]